MSVCLRMHGRVECVPKGAYYSTEKGACVIRQRQKTSRNGKKEPCTTEKKRSMR